MVPVAVNVDTVVIALLLSAVADPETVNDTNVDNADAELTVLAPVTTNVLPLDSDAPLYVVARAVAVSAATLDRFAAPVTPRTPATVSAAALAAFTVARTRAMPLTDSTGTERSTAELAVDITAVAAKLTPLDIVAAPVVDTRPDAVNAADETSPAAAK